ncbi:MAG: hypothetical protein M1837_005759 [Sclerophora amabilis]|nr:MAG: hypothetical protein M1837_005759 [Sclerophora amabilis]
MSKQSGPSKASGTSVPVPGGNQGQDDYRFRVDSRQLVCASIGAFVNGDNLEPSAATNVDGFRDSNVKGSKKYPLETLEQFMGKMLQVHSVSKKLSAPSAYRMEPTFRFKDDLVLAQATCFYVGDGVVATAGHCVFEGTGQVKDDIQNMSVVFGLTQEMIEEKRIPAANVFGIERVLFGQNLPFNDVKDRPIADRADWALLQLKANAASRYPQPLQLAPLGPQERVPTHAWAAGHPWGIGMTMVSPLGNSGWIQGVGSNAVQHNLRIVPANSGGPLLSGQNQVIGIAASGRGDILMSRGFLWLGDLDPSGTMTPFYPKDERYDGTRTNIWSSLLRPDSSLFLAFSISDLPGKPDQQNGKIEILVGKDDATANWFPIYEKVAPESTQLVRRFPPAASPDLRPYHIREIRHTFTFPSAAFNRSGGRGAVTNVNVPTIKSLVFGCLRPGDEKNPENWTILYRNDQGLMLGGVPDNIRLGPFLPPDWKPAGPPWDLGAWDVTKWVDTSASGSKGTTQIGLRSDPNVNNNNNNNNNSNTTTTTTTATASSSANPNSDNNTNPKP